jgi:hypothetical protein
MVRQRENDVWSSVSFAHIAVQIWRQFYSINDNGYVIVLNIIELKWLIYINWAMRYW